METIPGIRADYYHAIAKLAWSMLDMCGTEDDAIDAAFAMTELPAGINMMDLPTETELSTVRALMREM